MTNEHPDMSGNPADFPFLCDNCQREFQEDKAFGSDLDDEKLFCSGECAEDWEEKQREPLDAE